MDFLRAVVGRSGSAETGREVCEKSCLLVVTQKTGRSQNQGTLSATGLSGKALFALKGNNCSQAPSQCLAYKMQRFWHVEWQGKLKFKDAIELTTFIIHWMWTWAQLGTSSPCNVSPVQHSRFKEVFLPASCSSLMVLLSFWVLENGHKTSCP